jgi:hypothetical protein
MSEKEVTVSTEDLDALEKLRVNKQKLLKEIQDLGVLRYNLKKREKEAIKFDEELSTFEQQLQQHLAEKYGKGSMDIDKKVFTPSKTV